MKEHTKIILLSNITVFVTTLLGVIVSNRIGTSPTLSTYICYVLIGTCLACLLLIYGQQLSQTICNNLLELRQWEGIKKSVPSVLVMERRRDRFLIQKDFSGILDLHFEIKTNLEEPVRDIPFPIYAEKRRSKQSTSPVRLLSLSVDGREESTNDRYYPKEIRHPFAKKKGGTNVMEYGLLMVPVRLQKGAGQCTIDISLKLEGSFPNISKKEFVIIEVPYITKKLEVVLEAEDELAIKRISGSDQTIIATPSNTDFKDQRESFEQNVNWRNIGGRIEWVCKYPKIGYSYIIYFKTESGNVLPV